MCRTLFAILAALGFLAVLLSAPCPARASSTFGVVSETNLGYSAPLNLSTTPETAAIRMGGAGAGEEFFTKLTLVMVVIWGTSVVMNVQCRVSGTGASADYGYITKCPSGVCDPRTWVFTPADGTNLSLDLETNYPYIKCTQDDPADGTGTVRVHAIRGN